MLPVPDTKLRVRVAGVAAAVLLLVAIVASPLSAAVDLSLNVLYQNPANPNSGGTWQLAAKSDGFGLSLVKALITGIDTAQLNAPRGKVNGTDPAGFSLFTNTLNASGYNELNFSQIPIPSHQLGPTEEQSVFYGVGTLANGAPNYPDKPPLANSIGPAFTSLTDVAGVPWATGDTFLNPAWNTSVILAQGTFAAGKTPGFFQAGDIASRGNTFLSLPPNNREFGTISNPTAIATTIVRSNFSGLAGDYNRNGVVDAADNVVWRNTLGSTTVLDADGNGNGVIDPDDYDFWRARFGSTSSSSGGGGDYNQNGIIDAPDYVVWRNTLGSSSMLSADGNGNGVIDQGDYDIWRARFGNTSASGAGSGASYGATAVPEPAGGLLAALALVSGFLCVRPRRA